MFHELDIKAIFVSCFCQGIVMIIYIMLSVHKIGHDFLPLPYSTDVGFNGIEF